MEYYEISRYRIRYVIPFEIDIENSSFEQVCRKVEGYTDYPYSFLGEINTSYAGHWIRSSLRKGEQDVYPYIVDEFAFDGCTDADGTIGKTGCFWKYSLFEDHPLQLEYTDGKNYEQSGKKRVLSISDMGLYIFRSGIGLIWYEIQGDAHTFETSKKLIEFQNVMKELNRANNNHLWIKSQALHFPEKYLTEAYHTEVVPFMLGNWIAERLQFLEVGFLAQRNNSYASLLRDFYYKGLDKKERNRKELYYLLPKNCADKALAFSYVVFRRGKDWVKNEDSLKTAYYLASGYKESYEMSSDIDTVVKNPFSNVYWMAAREGCGYFAWEGEKNRIFFEKNQYAKIMNDYFLLYIRAVYQSYSLMRYAVLVSGKLSNDYHVYVNVNDKTEQLSKQISAISTEINLFLVKSIVTSVSYVHHQNEFYDYLVERMQIKEDAESVTAGLSSLKELQHETLIKKQNNQKAIELNERETEAQREKEADNMFQIGLGLMTFLAVISAVTDSYGIVSGLADSQIPQGWFLIFVILFCICMIILAVSITIFIKSIRNLKKNGKKEN